jgi:hypothetical protein
LANTTQTITASYSPADNVHSSSNTSAGVILNLQQRLGVVGYIGPTVAMTSGSSSTTAQVSLSASVTDPNPAGDSVANSTVTFKDLETGNVLASGVKVNPVSPTNTGTGTANTIVTLSTGKYGAQQYLIEVILTGDYTNSDQLGTNGPTCASSTSQTSCAYATVTVMIPPTTNSIQGAAGIPNSSSAAGTYAGVGGASYTVGMSYNKGGTNPQGQIQLTLPQSDGSYVYVKSNSISSLAFSNPNTSDGSLPKDVTIYTKASLYRINPLTGVTTSIDGNVTLRVDAHEGCNVNSNPNLKGNCLTTTGDTIGFTVLSSKNSALYYSNNWGYDSVSKSYRTLLQAVSGANPNVGCAVEIN